MRQKEISKIEIEEIKYYGARQGYKIYIKGKKYPRARGEWYTGDKGEAIKHALRESKVKLPSDYPLTIINRKGNVRW